MECQKCGRELSGPDDTHLCRPATRDIIEAATLDSLQRMWVADGRGGVVAFVIEPGKPSGTGPYICHTERAFGWLDADERQAICDFIAHFDPTHVSAMEDVCEAARKYARGGTGMEGSYRRVKREVLRAALAHLNELRET